ncbi:hypothetical protein [Microcoleus sp. D2_18a_D3]|uniref:hypothetical protein n=1 Tax=Microcoleus sp. D2_18a_D3 TaxID=3055330 RepID=UPI002FD6043F
MQRIFEAILKGNLLEWAKEVPRQGDRPVRVYVTLQEERSTLSGELRRQRIVEILEKIAANNVFAEISDPVKWQRHLRQDRPLPGRDE